VNGLVYYVDASRGKQMKFLLAALCLSVNAYAMNLGIEGIGRSDDGKAAACKTPADNNNFGYGPSNFAMSVQNGTLHIALTMLSHICVASDTIPAHWEEHKFGDPVPTENGVLIPSQQQFFLVDESSNILSTVDVVNAVTQDLAYNLPIKTFLTKDQQKQLDSGKTVNRRLNFFLQSVWTFKNDKETIPLGLRAGGAQAITIDMSKNADGSITVQ
jgi:hypothetical protein